MDRQSVTTKSGISIIEVPTGGIYALRVNDSPDTKQVFIDLKQAEELYRALQYILGS